MPLRKVKKVTSAAKKKVKKATSSARKATTRVVRKTSGSAGNARQATKTSAKRRKKPTPTGKHVGDVLGISAVRVPTGTPRATEDRGGNPKGIEIGRQAKGPAFLNPSRTRF